ncbi:protein spindle-F isoform X2 [Nylanderia fulva]|uniref:protein spindle-F isoform X2 n=1 Tax=Nylanderia fulva TaxID=613905 RepID=UPI0010FB7FA3|nr:protein spindle-F isoform X2 [Nylanderia fulva]
MNENLENVTPESYYALLVAFETMKERCQRLQTRLVAAEKENMRLKLECSRNSSTAVVKANNSSDESTLQEKIEELTKQKLQLSDHMFMVAAENRQLWNRLTRLTKTNKSLGEKEQSLEEISLRLINSIMLEKSDLEQQYAEMVELQNNSELNLQKIGFTYPEDSDTDSELKQLEIRLSQTKDALLGQQTRLKRTLQNLKKMRKGTTCNNCRENANKKMCQTGTQFDSNDSFKEHGATQTSLMTPSISIEKYSNLNDNLDIANTCPLCGTVYGKSKSFTEFHEHVLNHFTKDVSTSDDFELVH